MKKKLQLISSNKFIFDNFVQIIFVITSLAVSVIFVFGYIVMRSGVPLASTLESVLM